MSSILLTIAAVVSINIQDVETDGTHNYLLQFTRDQTPYFVSYSNKKPLVFDAQGKATAVMRIECEAGPTIDEKMSDKLGQWVSYTVNTCDMVEILKWNP